MIRDKQRPVATAAVAALRETAANSVQEGRSNIAGAGRFGPKWQQGLQYPDRWMPRKAASRRCRPRPSSFISSALPACSSTAPRSRASRCCGYRRRRAAPPASRSGKKLTSATVRGQPMLFDADDRDRDRKPLYIGVPSVRIPKKLRITEIVKENVAKIALVFIKHFKGD